MQVTVLNGALPITYIDLTYSIVDRNEIIKWIIQGENITESFLQRSYDGQNFTDIQKVDPIGVISLQREIKNAWFRVRSISDQQEKKSKIILIKGINEEISVWQYGSNCMIDSNDEGLYFLFNTSGQLIQKGFISIGSNQVDIKNYKGVLYISVKTKKGVYNFSAVVK